MHYRKFFVACVGSPEFPRINTGVFSSTIMIAYVFLLRFIVDKTIFYFITCISIFQIVFMSIYIHQSNWEIILYSV